ncbi:Dynein heavy chain, cytoplasmic, partial [Gryllus bimaculatus]
MDKQRKTETSNLYCAEKKALGRTKAVPLFHHEGDKLHTRLPCWPVFDIQDYEPDVPQGEYPLLMQAPNWTRSKPKKEMYGYSKPSESIGSCYTPTAKFLRINNMPPRRPAPLPDYLDPEGKLCFPPKRLKIVKKRKTTEITDEDVGIVKLKDLLKQHATERSATKNRKSAEKEMAHNIRKEMKQQLKDEINRKIEAIKMSQLEAIEPIHPDDQLKMLKKIVEEEQKQEVMDEDLVKIAHYLDQGIDYDMIEPYPGYYLKNAKRLIKDNLLNNERYEELIFKLEAEIKNDWNLSLRQAILEYILLDPDEWTRLDIYTYPIPYGIVIIRAPVPWHNNYVISKQLISHKLFIGNDVLLRIRDLWSQSFSHLLVVPTETIREQLALPCQWEDLNSLVDKCCSDINRILNNEWLPKCAEIFLEMKSSWEYLVPQKMGESLLLVQTFFDSASSLVALEVRDLILKSLMELLSFIVQYKDGNDFGEKYEDCVLNKQPLITMKVLPVPGKAEFTFSPTADHIRDFIRLLFRKIINVNTAVPRIEAILFPGNHLILKPVRESEEEISDLIKEAVEAFDTNIVGPIAYMREYEPYFFILDGSLERSTKEFMSQDPEPLLEDYKMRIKGHKALKEKIALLRNTIPLNFLSLDCSELNEILWKMVDDDEAVMVNHHVSENRTLNRGICNVFEEMSDKVSELPESTAELVELCKYHAECRDVTMFNLREKIRTAAQNVLFLMSHALLSPEDIFLNSRVFVWPADMEAVLELSQQRLAHRREMVEIALKTKREEFDARLVQHQKELEFFKKKDPPILTMEDMEENAEIAKKLLSIIMEDKKDGDAINKEEVLLDLAPSPFVILQQMVSGITPLELMWRTVLKFHKNYDKWYYGPFSELNAEEIGLEIDEMFKTLYKLARQLQDAPGAKRIAEMVRAKVEKFKQFIPLLHVICNQGLQERHWKEISEVAGVDITPEKYPSLNDMVEAGLMKYVTRLDEISVSATKEYALEQNLQKMKEEWADIEFECVPYRDTGTYILTAVDDIQQMLDDNILKAQTMRGSPYVKPFEKEMHGWESKLITMQDILDAWLLCQSTWMYLEPIFSSEDIMRQMPEEARKFKHVDGVWRSIMANTNKDKRVLKATEFPGMLKLLRENNNLLDEIQKGLNDYLEKKRLFFPRFFFLSNDELLEILSETKDPLRVQPHLKKCFEGISQLDFTPQQEIVGMMSAQKETVPFSGSIFPLEAKGLVEKWLVEVEAQMRISLRDIVTEAVAAYFVTPRNQWVLNWPGQIVLCVGCIYWTAECAEALEERTVMIYKKKCDTQIEDLVTLVRGFLSPGAQITICALIVIDVH